VRYQGADFVATRKWNYGKVPLSTLFGLGSYIGFQSGWEASTFLFYDPGGFDQTATRGGPLTVSLRGEQIELNVGSDNRRKIAVTGYGYVRNNSESKKQGNIGASITVKPAPNFQLSLGPRYSINNTFAAYVRREDDATATGTYGRRYVFAERNQRSLSLTTRASYTFTPALSLQLYLEPFTSSASHSHFKELRRPRNADYVDYGKENGSTIVAESDPTVCDNPDAPAGSVACYTVDPDGPGAATSFSFANPDRAFRSLRGTSVLRWEYRPGATFFAVWTQNRSASLRAADYGGMRDVGGLFDLPVENVFLLKVNYWFSR
jgi:hypothetical protein